MVRQDAPTRTLLSIGRLSRCPANGYGIWPSGGYVPEGLSLPIADLRNGSAVAENGFVLQYTLRMGSRRDFRAHGKCFFGSKGLRCDTILVQWPAILHYRSPPKGYTMTRSLLIAIPYLF